MKNVRDVLAEAVDGKIDLLHKIRMEEKNNPAARKLKTFTSMERHIAMCAPVYCWDPEIVGTVLESTKSLPGDVRMDRSLLHSDEGWWWFGRYNKQFNGHYSAVREEADFRQTLCGMAYTFQADCCIIYAYSYDHHEPSFGPVPVWMSAWKIGQTLNEYLGEEIDMYAEHLFKDIDKEERQLPPELHSKFEDALTEYGVRKSNAAMLISKFFVAANVWLGQKILEQTPMVAPRAAAKRAARASVDINTASLRYVRLRRKENIRERTAEEAQQVNWSCRWVVEGFYRNQHYATLGPKEDPKAHKLIWIDSFVKGPEGKPLKPRGEKVFVVDR